MEKDSNRDVIRLCPRCGEGPITWRSKKEIVCPSCGFSFFLNVAAAVVGIIARGDEILLTVRGIEPGKGMLDLPGGFLEPGESGEEAIRRELKEELGVDAEGVEYLFSFPNRYPCGGITYQVLDLFYLVEVKEPLRLSPQDDVQGVHWVDRARVDLSRVAFPSIRSGLRRYLGGD